MKKAELDESQAGIKTAERNINNLRHADDTTLMAESEEELKSLLMKVKEEIEKAGLKLNIQKLRSWHLVPSLQFSCLDVSDSFPWTAACQASLSIIKSWRLPKLMSIVSVMPSNHLILCLPLLPPPSIFPSIRVFSNESALHIRWPWYWSFSLNISPSMNTQD